MIVSLLNLLSVFSFSPQILLLVSNYWLWTELPVLLLSLQTAEIFSAQAKYWVGWTFQFAGMRQFIRPLPLLKGEVWMAAVFTGHALGSWAAQALQAEVILYYAAKLVLDVICKTGQHAFHHQCCQAVICLKWSRQSNPGERKWHKQNKYHACKGECFVYWVLPPFAENLWKNCPRYRREVGNNVWM